MRSLNAKTDDKTVKEKIIDEIVLNASYYRVFAQNGEYDEMTEKAFDVILANSSLDSVKQAPVSTINDDTDTNTVKIDDDEQPKAGGITKTKDEILLELVEKEVAGRKTRYLNRITKSANATKFIIGCIGVIVTVIWIIAIIPRTRLGKYISSQVSINYEFASLTGPIIATVAGSAMIALYTTIISWLKSEKTLSKKEQKYRKKAEKMYHIEESDQGRRQ